MTRRDLFRRFFAAPVAAAVVADDATKATRPNAPDFLVIASADGKSIETLNMYGGTLMLGSPKQETPPRIASAD